MPTQTSACNLTKKAGTSAAKAYTSLASSEIIESVEVIDSNLPVENYQKAMEVFSEAVRDIIKVGDVINLIHNEALQNLPDVRQRFFIRFEYGDKILEIGVNKYSNGNTQGFQIVGNRKI
eukprot:TRINITY_DN24219_c0_g1_i1.p1 TRINITY_DN24219_c0_g1~~TRINITY_DN24219_c0_g1_i1.p1  ORF type:complete len:120 (-),score=35.80 TRINITY_DN24219_c0_g1_i1:224-583(-)